MPASTIDCFGLGKFGARIGKLISVYCLMISNVARPRMEQVVYMTGIASSLLEGSFTNFWFTFFAMGKDMRGRVP